MISPQAIAIFNQLVMTGRIISALNGGAMPNIPFPTLGGKMMWDDIHECSGWRIQRNSFTGHYRILNPDNIRKAWGTEEAMENLLNKFL